MIVTIIYHESKEKSEYQQLKIFEILSKQRRKKKIIIKICAIRMLNKFIMRKEKKEKNEKQ